MKFTATPIFDGAAACVIAALLGWSVFYLHAAGVLRASKRQVDAKVATLSVSKRESMAFAKTRLRSIALPRRWSTPSTHAVSGRSCWRSEPAIAEGKHLDTELIPLSNGKPVLGAAVTRPNGNNADYAGAPVAGRTPGGGPAIDGLLIRGLYLWNARQQEVVSIISDFGGLAFFAIDPKNQHRVIKPTMRQQRVGVSLRASARSKTTLPLP